ncbi:MAG: hypothetical protein GY811_20125 [Myxococcales bacterium]|nr:hypothetical protein [Myxococcales bacterium]
MYSRSGTTWTQQAYFKASNTDSGDQFGQSVALSGDSLAIGACLEESNATGLGGDRSNDDAAGAGSFYIFR